LKLPSWRLNPDGMEPDLTTAPELLGVLEELRRREPIFHQPAFGTTRRDFEEITDPTFFEVGASGRRYSRQYVLDILASRPPDPDEASWATRDFHCREIGADNYLITYTLAQGQRITRRATLWRRTPGGWKILYHQGTIVE
jgi:hypothetical protein